MKYNRNLKVQYKSERLSIPSNNRYLLYRILPSELPLWKRLFCNKWHYAYYDVYSYATKSKEVNDLLIMIFSYDEANEFINKYKTFGELSDFLNEQYEKAQAIYNKINYIDNRWNF